MINDLFQDVLYENQYAKRYINCSEKLLIQEWRYLSKDKQFDDLELV